MKIKLSVIILSWNTKDLLVKCLNSLMKECQEIGGCEIIVVDNGSTDGSQKAIASMMSKVGKSGAKLTLIENKENLGYARGNNIGFKKASGEYVMVLNSDTEVLEGAIQKLVSFLDKNDQVSVVGPKLLNSDGSPQANCGRFPDLSVSAIMLFKEHFGGSEFVRFSPKESRFVDWLMGSAFMARRKVFDKVGGFDENIFMYIEEVEWFYRARELGLKAYFLKEAEIIHLGRGSSTTGKKDPILNIYRGLVYFYRKHKSPAELIILKIMLKLKAGGTWLIGTVSNNQYLKDTYAEAFKLV